MRDDITGINFPPAFYHPLVRIGGYYRLGDRPPAYQLRHVVRTVSALLASQCRRGGAPAAAGPAATSATRVPSCPTPTQLVNPGFVSGFVDENGDRDVALMLLSKPSTKTPIALPRYTRASACAGASALLSVAAGVAGAGMADRGLLRAGADVPRSVFRCADKPSMPLPAMSRLTAMGWGWTKPSVPSEAEALQQVGEAGAGVEQ